MMFAQEAERLRRKTWKDTNELAEELYAILSNDDLPLSHSGPITLNAPDNGEAPLTLNGSEGGDTIINITPAGLPDSSITINNEGTPQFPGNSTTSNVANNILNTQAPSAFVGTVRSGTGRNYILSLAGGRSVTARCLGIALTETVPAGTEVIAVKDIGGYFFQVPLWT